jgi:hypothetical protein
MIPSLHFMSIMHNSVLNHTGTKNSHLFHPARRLNASFIISRSEIFVKSTRKSSFKGSIRFVSSHGAVTHEVVSEITFSHSLALKNRM